MIAWAKEMSVFHLWRHEDRTDTSTHWCLHNPIPTAPFLPRLYLDTSLRVIGCQALLRKARSDFTIAQTGGGTGAVASGIGKYLKVHLLIQKSL